MNPYRCERERGETGEERREEGRGERRGGERRRGGGEERRRVFLPTPQHQHQYTATTLSLSSSTGASAVFAHLVPLPPSPPRQPLHTRLHHCAGRARAHTLRQSSLAHAAHNWLNSSPPSCCLASRCWTCDCGRSAMHRSRADPGYWDTAGYCRILRDTAGYWPSLMRILGYSAGLEDQVAPSIAVLLLGI